MFKIITDKRLFKSATFWEISNKENTESITILKDGSISIRYYARYKKFKNIQELIRNLTK